MEESLFLEDDPGVAGFFAEREKKSWFLSVHQLVSYSLFRFPKSTRQRLWEEGVCQSAENEAFAKVLKAERCQKPTGR